MSDICKTCGQLTGIEAYDEKLWELYHRLKSGVSHYEPLVFHSDWLQENVCDEEDMQAVNGAMEKDMHNRGLCVTCGRPNLSGKTEDDFYTEEEADGMAEMYAEQAAERRMGC